MWSIILGGAIELVKIAVEARAAAEQKAEEKLRELGKKAKAALLKMVDAVDAAMAKVDADTEEARKAAEEKDRAAGAPAPLEATPREGGGFDLTDVKTSPPDEGGSSSR